MDHYNACRFYVPSRYTKSQMCIRDRVEGEDEAQVTEFAHRIADAVKAV